MCVGGGSLRAVLHPVVLLWVAVEASSFLASMRCVGVHRGASGVLWDSSDAALDPDSRFWTDVEKRLVSVPWLHTRARVCVRDDTRLCVWERGGRSHFPFPWFFLGTYATDAVVVAAYAPLLLFFAQLYFGGCLG